MPRKDSRQTGSKPLERQSRVAVWRGVTCLGGSLCVGALLATSGAAQSTDQAVAEVGQHKITASDLERAAGNRMIQLRSQHYVMTRAVLENLIAEYVLKEEARRLALTDAQMDDRIRSMVKEVTAQEAKLVYEATRDRYPNMAESDALKSIDGNLRERRLTIKRREVVRELRSKYGVRVLLEPPRVAVDVGHSPSRGPSDAIVTLLEFSDYQCPFCAKMAPTIRELEKMFPTELRVVYRDFPLSIHPQAGAAAEAAHCAGEQGRYWEMHDRLFANQARLAPALFVKLATEVGLDEVAFEKCVDSGQYAQAVRNDERDGRMYGVMATPSVFVNGRFFSGLVPIEILAEAIEEEVAAARAKRNTQKGSGIPQK